MSSFIFYKQFPPYLNIVSYYAYHKYIVYFSGKDVMLIMAQNLKINISK